MRLDVLADVHGNISARQYMIDDIRKEGIDNFIVLGDFVKRAYTDLSLVTAKNGVTQRGNLFKLITSLP